MATEADRLMAVLKGSKLAVIHPGTWHALRRMEELREEVSGLTEAQKLKDELEEKMRKLAEKRKNKK